MYECPTPASWNVGNETNSSFEFWIISLGLRFLDVEVLA